MAEEISFSYFSGWCVIFILVLRFNYHPLSQNFSDSTSAHLGNREHPVAHNNLLTTNRYTTNPSIDITSQGISHIISQVDTQNVINIIQIDQSGKNYFIR